MPAYVVRELLLSARSGPSGINYDLLTETNHAPGDLKNSGEL